MFSILTMKFYRGFAVSFVSFFGRIKIAQVIPFIIKHNAGTKFISASYYTFVTACIGFMFFTVSTVLRLGNNAKIFSSVVMNNTIDVVNKFRIKKFAIQNTLHNFSRKMNPFSRFSFRKFCRCMSFLGPYITFLMVVPCMLRDQFLVNFIANKFQHFYTIQTSKPLSNMVLGVGYRLYL